MKKRKKRDLVYFTYHQGAKLVLQDAIRILHELRYPGVTVQE